MKRKKITLKRILKIITGVVIFFTLPSILFFGVIYLKYNEPLPRGIQNAAADQLATFMLDALNYEAYKNTDYLEWTFTGRHHYQWNKSKGKCEVSWKQIKVVLDFNHPKNSKVYVADQLYNGMEKEDYIKRATDYFNNDSFWLVAPYKVFDKDTERLVVKNEDGSNSLLVTYTQGGTTPGDSYLWHFDKSGKPKSYQMWVDILPIGGLEATWNQWITTESGAILPSKHDLFFLEIDMGEVKGKKISP